VTKDVAIVGGSAAGFFTAYLLAKQGIRPWVFEAAERIGATDRTLIATNRMHDMLGALCERAVVNKIHRFELRADGRFAKIELRQPDLVFERSNLIKELADKAEAAGTQICTGMRFLAATPQGRKLKLILSGNGNGGREVAADVLVGADGALSKVARDAGLPGRPTVCLNQAVVALPRDMSVHTARVWFIPEETPYFFWLIPHSPTHGVLGLIGEAEPDTQRALMQFLEKTGLAPLSFQSGRIPLYVKQSWNNRKAATGNVYVVGDAAGHVKNSTVGGIVAGFRGAHGVAAAIVRGEYSRELRALRWELNRHQLIRKVLHRFTQMDYVALLKLLSRSNKRSLSSLSRDETGKLLAHLLIANPRLLLLGMRSLLIGR
jgi:flavin-dependent dehydrogenase